MIPADLTSDERSVISRAIQDKFNALGGGGKGSKGASSSSAADGGEVAVGGDGTGDEAVESSSIGVMADAEIFAALREELERATKQVVDSREGEGGEGCGGGEPVVAAGKGTGGAGGEELTAPDSPEHKADDDDYVMTTNTAAENASPGGTHRVGRTLIEVDGTVSVDYMDDEHDFDQTEVGDGIGEKGEKVEYEKRIFHQSSHDMLRAAADSMLEDQSMIQDFINQIKDNSINSPQTSDFRARRLTFAKAPLQMKEEDEESEGGDEFVPPSSPNPDGDETGDMTPMLAPTSTITKRMSYTPAAAFKPRASGRYERQRTTIYASAEMGVQQKATQPFPKDVMGTFSCHGIEPGYEEGDEDGIHQKDNQDRGCCVYPFKSHPREALFMVLDGHGPQGDAVSEFAMRQVVVSLERSENMLEDPETTLKDAFIKTNAALMVTPIEYMTSGTTLVAVYMRETHFWIAHVGDSRVVCAVQEGDGLVAHNACEDHKPDNPEEKARIEAWGGFVSPAPEEGMSSRVWLDEDWTMIGLAMARSIGDYAVKAVGVIPEPEVQRHDVTENHKFMILASDGVWEFISSQEAVEIVASKIHLGADMACENLIHQATERWAEEEGDYRDDITAIVFTFPLPWETQHLSDEARKKP